LRDTGGNLLIAACCELLVHVSLSCYDVHDTVETKPGNGRRRDSRTIGGIDLADATGEIQRSGRNRPRDSEAHEIVQEG
jgi:hypothetical protein